MYWWENRKKGKMKKSEKGRFFRDREEGLHAEVDADGGRGVYG
jgi:hypothetical protein